MTNASDKLHELENDACLTLNEATYPITFDGNNLRLRVILSNAYGHEPIFIYRRGGLDLTFDQAADLIRRNQRN